MREVRLGMTLSTTNEEQVVLESVCSLFPENELKKKRKQDSKRIFI